MNIYNTYTPCSLPPPAAIIMTPMRTVYISHAVTYCSFISRNVMSAIICRSKCRTQRTKHPPQLRASTNFTRKRVNIDATPLKCMPPPR